MTADKYYIMPREWRPHKRCWMAFVSSRNEAWGVLLQDVQQEQARVANAIGSFEPVTMLACPEDVPLVRKLCRPSIEVMEMEVDDVWIRDSGPTFVLGEKGGLAGVTWNFYSWGNKFDNRRDQGVAEQLMDRLGAPLLTAPIVCEGGAFHVDGAGTLITTESCLLNENRNPGLTKTDVESAYRVLLGVNKVIWIPGCAQEPITDGYVDGICFFARPGLVVAQITDDPYDPEYKIMQENLRALQLATDATGNRLDVIRILPPRYDYLQDKAEEFADSYVNCYLPNGGIVMAAFGDPVRDQDALTAISKAMPARKAVQLRIDAIASGGGGIHCMTQQEPAASAAISRPSQAVKCVEPGS